MSLLDELQGEHGEDIQRHLVSQLGLTEEQAAAVLPKVGPLIMGALKQRMDMHGEEHVQGHVDQLGADDLSDVGEVLRSGAQNGDPDLGGLMGGKGQQASQMMAQHLGISPGTALKILPMLAPLIIGLLKRRSAGGTPGANPGGGGGLGGLGSILDRNGDGSILDDLGGLFGGGGTAGGTPGAAGKSGCLGSLLGGLLKGRQ
jgi:hypothetical protein